MHNLADKVRLLAPQHQIENRSKRGGFCFSVKSLQKLNVDFLEACKAFIICYKLVSFAIECSS